MATKQAKNIQILTTESVHRFWSGINLTANPDLCWEWKKGHSRYGQFWFNNTPYLSHRIAYYLHYKKDPDKFLVCHSCDNSLCCNPNHLWLGDDNDNMQDMIKKGRDSKACGDKNGSRTCPERRPKGSRIGVSKLKEEQVFEIHRLYSSGKYSHSDIGAVFNVSASNVGLIINKKRWRHIYE